VNQLTKNTHRDRIAATPFTATSHAALKQLDEKRYEAKNDGFAKVQKTLFPSFRRKPGSRSFIHLQNTWTPVVTGVTTFKSVLGWNDATVYGRAI